MCLALEFRSVFICNFESKGDGEKKGTNNDDKMNKRNPVVNAGGRGERARRHEYLYKCPVRRLTVKL